MVAPSKIYQEPICRIHCSQAVVHPGQSCLQFSLHNIIRSGISSGKYFLPLLISPLVLKWKSMNMKLFLNSLKLYLQAVGWSAASSNLIFLSVCIFRNMFGIFNKYTILSIPSFIGMSLCWFYPQRVVDLFALATSQASMEVILRQRSTMLTRHIYDSKTLQTILFMLNSSIILHFKRSKMYNGFWFIQPNALVKDPTNLTPDNRVKSIDRKSNCTHAGQSCRGFVWIGIKNYIWLGAPLDLLNMVMRGKVPQGTKGFWSICLAKLKTLHLRQFKMTAFFLTYIGIYRLSTCLLQHFIKTHNDQWPHMLSAFFGGASYIWLGTLSFYTLSLVITIQILWHWFCSKKTSCNNTEEQNSFLEQLINFKISRVLVPLNIAILVHCYMFHYHLVSSLGRGFINGVTDFKTKRIYDYLTSRSLDVILNEASGYATKGFF